MLEADSEERTSPWAMLEANSEDGTPLGAMLKTGEKTAAWTQGVAAEWAQEAAAVLA